MYLWLIIIIAKRIDAFYLEFLMQGMESDVPVMTRYLSQINSQLEKVREHAALLKQHVDSQKFGAKEGVDLLGLKNQLLLRCVATCCSYVNWCLELQVICFPYFPQLHGRSE